MSCPFRPRLTVAAVAALAVAAVAAVASAAVLELAWLPNFRPWLHKGFWPLI